MKAPEASRDSGLRQVIAASSTAIDCQRLYAVSAHIGQGHRLDHFDRRLLRVASDKRRFRRLLRITPEKRR